jgi:hypothetical protein
MKAVRAGQSAVVDVLVPAISAQNLGASTARKVKTGTVN